MPCIILVSSLEIKNRDDADLSQVAEFYSPFQELEGKILENFLMPWDQDLETLVIQRT
jgi:hypothetical protein